MTRTKFSAAIVAAAIGFGAFGTIDAEARQKHWFYGYYGHYDSEAYEYDDTYDGGDVYVPPRYRREYIERRKRRIRRWVRRRNERIRRRANRQRLYDARRYGYRDQAPIEIYEPRRRKVKKYRPPIKITNAPLPRAKPYHLIPGHAQFAEKQPETAIEKTAKKTIEKTTGEKTVVYEKVKPEIFPVRPIVTIEPIEKAEKPTKAATPVPAKLEKAEPKLAKVEKPKAKTVETKKIEPKKAKLASLEPKKSTLAKPEAAKPKFVKPVLVPKKVEKPKPEIKIKKAKKKPEPKPVRIKVVKSTTPKKPKLADNQLSCNKVKSIVSDFGFSDITPVACTGKIYDFSAKRDGKPYSIKVSSLNGELKGVKKIK